MSENAQITVLSPETVLVADAMERFPVDARKLHAWLEVGRDFSTWVKARISEFEFQAERDFSPNLGKTPGRPLTEYMLTLSMAKHLAMIERSDKGRVVRDYFIACEERLKRVSGDLPMIAKKAQAAEVVLGAFLKMGALLGTPDSISKAHAVLETQRNFPDLQLKPLLAGNVSDIQEKLLTPTELGKHLGLSAIAANRLLATKIYQVKMESGWQLTDLGKVHGVYLDTGKKHSNGSPVQQVKWKESVLKTLQE